jgi:hypothetical protein
MPLRQTSTQHAHLLQAIPNQEYHVTAKEATVVDSLLKVELLGVELLHLRLLMHQEVLDQDRSLQIKVRAVTVKMEFLKAHSQV